MRIIECGHWKGIVVTVGWIPSPVFQSPAAIRALPGRRSSACDAEELWWQQRAVLLDLKPLETGAWLLWLGQYSLSRRQTKLLKCASTQLSWSSPISLWRTTEWKCTFCGVAAQIFDHSFCITYWKSCLSKLTWSQFFHLPLPILLTLLSFPASLCLGRFKSEASWTHHHSWVHCAVEKTGLLLTPHSGHPSFINLAKYCVDFHFKSGSACCGFTSKIK